MRAAAYPRPTKGAPAGPQGPDSPGLADILALSRLSVATVALHGAWRGAAALLDAARSTGAPREIVFYFDLGDAAAGPDLAEALRLAIDGAPADVPVLAILDRFEVHLALPPDHPRARADAQTLCALAAEAGSGIHFLLLVEESAAPLLQRYAACLPDLAGASLHLPSDAGTGDSGRDDAAQGKASDADAHGRERRFGALLERWTDRVAAAPGAVSTSTERDIEDRALARAMASPQRQAAGQGASIAAGQVMPECEEEQPAAAQADLRQQAATDAPARALASSDDDAADDAYGEAAALHAAGAPELGVTPALMPDASEASTPPAGKRLHATLAGIAVAFLAVALATRFADEPGARPAFAAPTATQRPEAPKMAAAGPETGPAAAMTPAAPATTATPPDPLSAPQARLAGPAQPPGSAPAEVPAAPAEVAAAAAAVAPGPVRAPRRDAAPTVAAAQRVPVLLILVGGKRDSGRARALAQNLARRGLAHARIRTTGSSSKASDLRYFHPEERNAALGIRQALAGAGYAAPHVRLVQNHGKPAARRPMELRLAAARGN